MKNKYIKSMALLSLVAAGTVQAQESELATGMSHQSLDSINSIDYSPNAPDVMQQKGFGSGTYYVWVAASGASATSSALDYSYSGGGCMQQDGNSQLDGDLDVNVQLPDGHQVLGFRYYWNDNSASSSSAILWQFDGLGSVNNFGTNTSTGDTGTGSFYLDLSADNIIVNNAAGSYTIRFNSNENGSAQEMCAVRLFMDADPV